MVLIKYIHTILIARNPKRKTALDYIDAIFDEFIELHGDRNFKDDKAIVCGLGKIRNQNFTIIAEQKGRTTKENIERNFGMPNPESYRKAIRFIIAIVIGEGSSGGALALGVANKVLMLENAIYSILSPEGYSSILWKDSSRYKEAAEKMKLTAKDLYNLKVIDKIIKEPEGEEKEVFGRIVTSLKNQINKTVKEMETLAKEEIVQERYNKFRNMGEFINI